MLGETIDYADIAVQTLRDTLQERSEARLDERIEALGSLVEQFKFIDERLEDFAQEFSGQILAEPLASLREQLQEFATRATAQLAPLHVEQEHRRIRPTPPPFAAKTGEEVHSYPFQRYSGWRTSLDADWTGNRLGGYPITADRTNYRNLPRENPGDLGAARRTANVATLSTYTHDQYQPESRPDAIG